MEHNIPAEVTILRMQTLMARGTEYTRIRYSQNQNTDTFMLMHFK